MSESKPEQSDYGLQFETRVSVDEKSGMYYVTAGFSLGMLTTEIHVPVNGVPGFTSAFRKGMLDTMREAIRMETQANRDKLTVPTLWTPDKPHG